MRDREITMKVNHRNLIKSSLGEVVFSCYVDSGLSKTKACAQAKKEKISAKNSKDWRGFSYNKNTGRCEFR